MKKPLVSILGICIAIIMICTVLFIKTNILGNLLRTIGEGELATNVYKMRYNLDKDLYSLERVSLYLSSIHNYKDSIYYLSELLKYEDYLNNDSDVSNLDNVKFYYMEALYKTGQKNEFKKYYDENLDLFNDAIKSRYGITAMIASDENATEEEIDFAINENLYLLSRSDIKERKDNIILNVYTVLKHLYKRVGDNDNANKCDMEIKKLLKKKE